MGSSHSIFYGDKIAIKLDQRSIHAFSSSLEKIKKIINNHHHLRLHDKLINPMTLTKSSSSSSSSHLHIAKLLKKYNPKVFSKEYVVRFDRPGVNLGHILIRKAKESYKTTGIFNSACLVDPFGNVLLSEGSSENTLSPIRTPFLELVRKYHRLLFEAGQEGNKYFAHLKYCKTVLLLGPGKDPKSIMEAGCFGASIEGELPKNRNDHSSQLQYVIQQQDPNDLKDMLGNLPPLYSKTIGIRNAITEVKDVELQDFCRSRALGYHHHSLHLQNNKKIE
jgi:hypothetical protein